MLHTSSVLVGFVAVVVLFVAFSCLSVIVSSCRREGYTRHLGLYNQVNNPTDNMIFQLATSLTMFDN